MRSSSGLWKTRQPSSSVTVTVTTIFKAKYPLWPPELTNFPREQQVTTRSQVLSFSHELRKHCCWLGGHIMAKNTALTSALNAPSLPHTWMTLHEECFIHFILSCFLFLSSCSAWPRKWAELWTVVWTLELNWIVSINTAVSSSRWVNVQIFGELSL